MEIHQTDLRVTSHVGSIHDVKILVRIYRLMAFHDEQKIPHKTLMTHSNEKVFKNGTSKITKELFEKVEEVLYVFYYIQR